MRKVLPAEPHCYMESTVRDLITPNPFWIFLRTLVSFLLDQIKHNLLMFFIQCFIMKPIVTKYTYTPVHNTLRA